MQAMTRSMANHGVYMTSILDWEKTGLEQGITGICALLARNLLSHARILEGSYAFKVFLDKKFWRHSQVLNCKRALIMLKALAEKIGLTNAINYQRNLNARMLLILTAIGWKLE